jgi:AsmA family
VQLADRNARVISLARSKLLYAGVSFAAVFIVLALILTSLDWNSFKGAIERSASARFGRKVTISGPLSVHLWSRKPTVTIVDLMLGSPPWESKRPLAHLDRMLIQLELRALSWCARLKPAFHLETGHLLKQGGAAGALSTLLTPLAAVLAFVDPGLAKDQNCAQLLAEAQPDTHLASGSPPNSPVLPEKR